MAPRDESTSGSAPRDRLRDCTLTDDVTFLLARANALSLAASNASLAEHGLRARSYAVLALAADGTRPSQRELADFLRLDPSQVVALVDDLEKRGLVRREAAPADRRTNVVEATPAGRDLFAAARRSARDAERSLHDGIPPEQRDRIAELLRMLAFPA